MAHVSVQWQNNHFFGQMTLETLGTTSATELLYQLQMTEE